jgi:hypothetical protein
MSDYAEVLIFALYEKDFPEFNRFTMDEDGNVIYSFKAEIEEPTYGNPERGLISVSEIVHFPGVAIDIKDISKALDFPIGIYVSGGWGDTFQIYLKGDSIFYADDDTFLQFMRRINAIQTI